MKMLKLALKSVKLFHTARVTTAAITIDKKNSRALIELPQMCIALFSDRKLEVMFVFERFLQDFTF